MRTNRQALVYPFATAATTLRGERWGIASTRLLAHAALQARIRRKAYHPASWMDVLRPTVRLAPFGRWPPFSSGLGWGHLDRLRICKSSRQMVSYSHTRVNAVL